MSITEKTKPIACPECGQIWTTDASKKDQLCLECSKPMSNERYLARIRHRHIDQGDTGPEDLQSRFLEATRRHFHQ